MRPPTGARSRIALEGYTLIQHHWLHAALMARLCDPVCSPEGFPRMKGEQHGGTRPETDDSVESVPDGVGPVASWAFSPTDGSAPASCSCHIPGTGVGCASCAYSAGPCQRDHSRCTAVGMQGGDNESWAGALSLDRLCDRPGCPGKASGGVGVRFLVAPGAPHHARDDRHALSPWWAHPRLLRGFHRPL